MGMRPRGLARDARSMFTEVGVRTAPTEAKPYRLTEAGGLVLIIQPKGGRSWQFRYRFYDDTKARWGERVLSLGSYPAVSLKEARQAVIIAKAAMLKGEHETLRRRRKRVAQPRDIEGFLFGKIGRDWIEHAAREHQWGERTRYQVEIRWAKYVEPVLGHRDLRTLNAVDAQAAIAPLLASDNPSVLRRVTRIVRDIFDFAHERMLISVNPVASIKLEAGSKRAVVIHRASFNRPAEVAELMRALNGYGGQTVGAALRLLPHLFVRPGELQHARWSEIDLENARWTIPAERMKMGLEHLVPLSRQVVAQLRDLRASAEGDLVFPGLNGGDRPISDNSMRVALRSLGYGPDRFTPHGFRAMARTMLDEQLRMNPNWIEAQLAHKVRDPLGRAYNRSTYLHDRTDMMQAWSDYLDKLVAGSTE